MTKKLYIHMGLPKTATSSIQKFLFENMELLHRNDLHYMQTGLNKNLKCHHDLIWKLGLHQGPSYVPKDITKYKEEALADLKRENTAYYHKNLIISSELLTFIDDYSKLSPIIEVFEDRDIIFILNIRRQDKFLESLYQQVVKDGCSSETFEEWLSHARNIADYNMRVEKILKITKKEKIIVNLFDGRRGDFNPTADFLRSLNVNLKNTRIDNYFENESLSNEAVESIRASNRSRSGINYLLAKKLKNKSSPKASYLSKQEREKLIEGFFESNEKLVRSLELSEEIRFKLNHVD